MSCTQHLRNNMKNILRDNRVSKEDEKETISRLFSPDGLVAQAEDTPSGVQHIKDLVFERPSVKRYVDRISEYLKTNLEIKFRPDILADYLWTNNNCESVNHQLNQMTEWESLHLVTLIDELEKFIKLQFVETKRAFVNVGKFSLAKEYSHFFVHKDVWQNKSVSAQKRHYNKFMKTPCLVRCGVSQSLTGAPAVLAPTLGGQKPGQRKRKRNAKTTTPSKRQM